MKRLSRHVVGRKGDLPLASGGRGGKTRFPLNFLSSRLGVEWLVCSSKIEIAIAKGKLAT
jgi:hypothetical protein